LSGALSTVTQYIRLLTPTSACAFYRYEPEADLFVCTDAKGDNSHLLLGLTIKNGERISGWAAANDKIIANSDAMLDLGQLAHQFDPILRSTLAAPVIHRGKIFGVLTAYGTKEASFTDHHKYAIERIVAIFNDKLSALNVSKHPNMLVKFPSADAR
jgi:GAF domain-containing protein